MLEVGSNVGWDTTGLTAIDNFGTGIAALGDLNGDGVANEIVVGDERANELGTDDGALYVMWIDPCPVLGGDPIVFDSPLDDGQNQSNPMRADRGARRRPGIDVDRPALRAGRSDRSADRPTRAAE